MDITTAQHGRRPDRPAQRGAAWWRARPRVERACLVTGTVLLVSGLVHLGLLLVDTGPWFGPVSWRKPATFGLSFGVTLLTVVWVTSYLRMSPRVRTVLLALFAADCVLETAGITVQAWRGVPSHLNMSTPTDTAVSFVLAGGGGLLIVLLSGFAAACFARRPYGPAAMPLALRAGFVLLLIGLLSGAGMIASGVVLARTGDQAAAYAATGFLKPLHGVSLHGIVLLPGLAWLLARTGHGPLQQQRLVRAATVLYGALVAAAAAWGLFVG